MRDRLNREKQLPIDDAVRIAHDTAEALDYDVLSAQWWKVI